MSWTKKELIEQAFDAIGLATYNFDLQPEQYQSALKKLDSMMASWNGRGLRLAYPLHSAPKDSVLTEDSALPDWAIEAAYLNLAIRIAPSFGKAVSPDTKKDAKDGYDIIMTRKNRPPEYQVTGLPRGQGQKSWRDTGRTTLSNPTVPLTDGAGDEIDFN